ncbi:hypothetical protein V6N12_032611 [Hibiscus sabdariffa]|uniref:Transposase MuDR plant domain-containing protein n=1 Tax=Hibiscus sabdariffa TaxID=183260 RepID=A0ABR2AG79_9ROSI
MNATGPNGPIGMDASHSDGSEGVSFSWDDGVLNEVDGNEGDGNEVDGNEIDGNEEARDEQHVNGADENEADLVSVCSEEETEYLDSADVGSYETDSDGDVISKKTGQVFFDSSTAHPRFKLGMIFENSKQFKEALYAYAVGNRFDFKFVSNKKEKVRVVCKGKGCPFVVHASRDKSNRCFKVKTLATDHNCSVTFKNSRANFKFVGTHFISKLRILPTLRSVQMIKLGKEELNVELNKKLCFRARKWALEKIRGSVVHEFHRLWDYVNTLRAADVRGTFDLVVERPNATDIPKFRRIYVCFSELREGFKMYCRPVVGLDGCFLKGSFKGEILSAVGRDCNNQIFPIAWVVVEVENRETWAWFLNNLQHDIGFEDVDGCTLLNDMQKVENHGPSPTPSAPPSSQTSHVPPSSQIPSPPSSQKSHVPPSSQISSPPSSQISSPPSSQTSHVPPSSQIPSAPQSAPQSTPTMVFMPTPSIQQLSELVAAPVLLSRPHTRSFTKPTSQPTSTTATPPVVALVSASSGFDATATVSPKDRLPKLTIKRHPPKN